MQMRGSSWKVSEESERGRERERVDTVNCSDWRTRQEIRKSSKSAKEPKAAEVSHVLSEVKAKQRLRLSRSLPIHFLCFLKLALISVRLV